MKSEYIKEMQELAALKAENERLLTEQTFDRLENLTIRTENERLRKEKDDVMLVAVTTRKENERLKEVLKPLPLAISYVRDGVNQSALEVLESMLTKLK